MLGWASQQFEKLSQAVAPPPADANGRFVYCVQRNDEDGAMACVPEMDAARAVLNPTRGSYAIHLACQHSMEKLIRLLLSQPGIDLTYVDSQGNTPMHYACMSTDKSCALSTIKMLVTEFKSPVTVKNSLGQTPYDFATLDMVRQYLLPIQLQAETQEAIDNGGVGLPPGIDMGGLRISNPAQPPPPTAMPPMPAYPAPAPASMPVQHGYQTPQHEIPPAPTSGQQDGYARVGSSSAAIYKPKDKRFVKADGFHSSSSDVTLQRKYGHVPVSGRAGVPPPPPSSGNSAGGTNCASPSGPNPFAGNSNPYTAGRAKARYVAYDARTGTAMPMPPAPAQPMPGYGQAAAATAAPNYSMFTPGAPATPAGTNVFNPAVPSPAQQPAEQQPYQDYQQQQPQLQQFSQLQQGEPQQYSQQPYYQQQQSQGQEQPHPQQQRQQAYYQPQAQQQQQQYSQPHMQQPYYQQQQGQEQPYQQQPTQQLQSYQQPTQEQHAYHQQPAIQNAPSQGQQSSEVQNQFSSTSPAPTSGGLTFSGDPNAAAALFSPQAAPGTKEPTTPAADGRDPPVQQPASFPAAPISGGLSAAAQAANAASATALFSSPSPSVGGPPKHESDQNVSVEQTQTQISGSASEQQAAPAVGSPFSGESKATSATELFAAPSPTGPGSAPTNDNSSSPSNNTPPVDSQVATSPTGGNQFSPGQATASTMFSSPAPVPTSSPQPSFSEQQDASSGQQWATSVPSTNASQVPARPISGSEPRTVSTSSAAEELFSSPSPNASNQASAQTTNQGDVNQSPTQNASQVFGSPSKETGDTNTDQNVRTGSPANSDEMLDDVPLSPKDQPAPHEQTEQQAPSVQPQAAAAPFAPSHPTPAGADSLFDAIGMPPPPFSSKR